MKNKYILITGSDGLVGSECVRFFCDKGYTVIGIDNNSRQEFFGKEASVLWNRKLLKEKYKKRYLHFDYDITNQENIEKIFIEFRKQIDLVIHCAAQPSHDWASTNPKRDYSVNSLGTLNLLEATRKFTPDASFIFTSTNKVYGDNPNKLDIVEEETRYTIKENSQFSNGIDETMSIDSTLHSLFGASKLSADILVQEYGKYFDMNTVCFRGGCLSGPAHSGTSLHGFLSYLVRSISIGSNYTIFGYKGKQVRDNIHSYDLVNAFYEFYKNPKSGVVYNIGGGNNSNCSMLEAISIGEQVAEKNLNYTYSEKPRIGDHIWYISDLTKFEKDYPDWKLTYNIDQIITEIYNQNIDRWKNE